MRHMLTLLFFCTFVFLTESLTMADETQEPYELTVLRESWNRAREEAASTIDEKYLDALRAMKYLLTAAGDAEGARAFDTEIKKLLDKQTAKSPKDDVKGSAKTTYVYLPGKGFQFNSVMFHWGENRETIRKKLGNKHQAEDAYCMKTDIYDMKEASFSLDYEDGELVGLRVHHMDGPRNSIAVEGVTIQGGRYWRDMLKELENVGKYKEPVRGLYLFRDQRMYITRGYYWGAEFEAEVDGFAAFRDVDTYVFDDDDEDANDSADKPEADKSAGNNSEKTPQDNGGDSSPPKHVSTERPDASIWTTAVLSTGDKPSRSYLGGLPPMYPNFKWPVRKNGKPLTFIACIDLAQMKGGPDWLPAKGWLLFFVDMEPGEQPWGDVKDQNKFAVQYVADPPKMQTDAEAHKGLNAEWMVKKKFLSIKTVEYRPIWSVDMKYDKLTKDEMHLLALDMEDNPQFEESGHQMGGYPFYVQVGPMAVHAQIRSHQARNTDLHKHPDRERKLEQELKDWQLLFQIDSNEDLNMMWGDSGQLYFWVNGAEARKCDFSSAWVELQSY